MAIGGFAKIKHAACSVTYAVCAFHFVTHYAVDVTLTKGPSMSPVISERGSLVLYLKPPLLRLLRGSSAPLYREGDIVIGVSPTDPGRHICKRICATEFSRRRSFVVPRGYVWLEGDNKSNSLDSRYYGAVSSHLLLGKVFFVVSLDRGAAIVY
ncbi:hypothetical protein X943_002253 [Babesia divergens]|uniref:Peptidase S26 domain-containing protein n=1 Tax=Babesia divergens TaxID=32595 RepID=A0AAD9LI91_BABDI|nr:hypothetical protein X943_002253 [Babesia divergens]